MKLEVEDLKAEFTPGPAEVVITVERDQLDQTSARFGLSARGLDDLRVWKLLQSAAMLVYANLEDDAREVADEWLESE